jgi:hypothetical protein
VRRRAWAREIRSHEQRPPECFSSSEGCFPIEILTKPGRILTIRELYVVSERVLFLKVPDLRIKSQRVGKNLCAKATSSGVNCEIFSIVFFLSSIFLCTVDIAPDVGFRRSWCLWKACATLFLKVLDLRGGELGFTRYGPTNRGHWSVFPCWGVIFRSRFRLD